MNYVFRGIFWAGAYLILILAPLFVLIARPMPGGNGFLYDFSLAIGFAAAAMMGVMFLLTARFKRATSPFGIDIIYYFHRKISIIMTLFVIAHPLLLFVDEPGLLAFLRPATMPWHLLVGIISTLAILTIMITSLWRKPLHVHYDEWRLCHAVLAAVALALAILHIEGVGHYVNMPWKKILWLLIGLSCAAVLVYVRWIKPRGLLRHPWKVAEVHPEKGDAWTLVLRPERGEGLSFLPGQFAWLTLWSTPFSLKEHPFSFASSAEHPEEIRFTIKELGDFTRRIREVRPGQTAYVDAPYGSFSIDRHPAAGYVFVAGGIGIAPVMSMLRTLADRGDRRPLVLFYGYSTWDRMTFREELEELAQRLNLENVFVLGEPHEGWEGETGVVTPDVLARHLPSEPKSCQYFICGPVPMIEAVEKALHRKGIPLRHIHSELFDLV